MGNFMCSHFLLMLSMLSLSPEYKEYKETRAKLLLRGGYFDSSEELCRTCVSTNTRTLMLGHNHAQALASQETLAKLVK